MKNIIFFFISGLFFSLAGNAQTFTKWTWNSGVKCFDPYSRYLMGDVNGDGKTDMIGVGAPDKSNAGYVYVGLSNGSGLSFWSWNSGKKLLDKNSQIAMGDVNGDGKDDLIAIGQPGSENAGWVYVGLSDGVGYSGWSWNSGKKYFDDGSKLLVGDVNGDGKDDLIGIGAAGKSNAGYVYIGLSDGLGFTAWSWKSESRLIEDYSIATMGDVNGDGKDDLFAGGQLTATNAGRTYIGISNGIGFTGTTNDFGNGFTFNSAFFDDINSDGMDDLIFYTEESIKRDSYYLLISNLDKKPMASINVFEDLSSIVAMSDVNGDGYADLIGIGRPGTKNAGWVYICFSKILK